MFKKIAMTTIVASALLMSMQASAHNYNSHHKHDAGINKEQRAQAVMIQQGIKNCKLTPSEVRRVQSTQRNITRLEKKFKTNGLSRWERETLQNKLHAARVEINKLTKNRITCRSKYRSNDRGHGSSNGRGHGASNGRSHGASNNGHSNNRSGGSISVHVRNIH